MTFGKMEFFETFEVWRHIPDSERFEFI